jgi:hypothetical protein
VGSIKKVIFLYFGLTQTLLSANLGQTVSFSQEVLPVLEKKCFTCHYPNGYAPFELTDVAAIKRHLREMAIVIKNGSMPPWKANAGFRDFAANRSLSEAEKKLLLMWLKQGAKVDSVDLHQKQITFKKDSPDVLLKMPRPYFLKASQKNTYICYKVPFNLDSTYAISALKFFADKKQVVHHATYQIFEVDTTVNVFEGPDYFTYSEDSVNRVVDDRDFNYFKMMGAKGELPREVYHGGWLPGTDKIVFPTGIGFTLPKRGVLLIRSLHYSPSAADLLDQSALGLYASHMPIERQVGFAAFQPRNPSPGYTWTIPADTVYKAHLNVKFNNDVSLLHINPHMHLIGKTFRAYAVTKFGDTIPLVDIPEWDFNWQDFYRFKSIVKIPAGSVLHAYATYDNTNANPNNPNFPAKAMAFETGMDESNEMMRLVILYLPYRAGDENISLE